MILLKNGPLRPTIALGSVSFGSKIPRERVVALLDVYAELGGNLLDTAHVYNSWDPGGEGTSETAIGEWLRANGMRDRMFLATKGGHPALGNMDNPRCGRHELESDLEASLRRLGVETVELYYLHRDDPRRTVEALVEAAAPLVASGRVGMLGVSNWRVERIEAANAYAARCGLPPFAMSQPRWALARRVHEMTPPDNTLDVDDVAWAWHRRTGFPMMPFTAQAKGFFGEANVAWARGGGQGSAPVGSRYDAPENHARLRAAMRVAEAHGCSAAQVALAYLLCQPFPVYPIVGTSRVEREREAMGAREVRLSAEECAMLEVGVE